MLNIGYLVPFTILKGLPDYEAYLVVLIDKGILAQLPKRYAMRDYKIGETGWASVFNIQGARVTLSQKSTQYVRKVMEHILSPLIQDGMIKVKRVAKMAGGSFYKVAVESLTGMSGSELLNEVKPYLEETKEYLAEKVIIIKYSSNVKEYIANSLVPAPGDKIRQIMIFENMKLADVKVSEEYVGKFLGPKAMNVLTAAKLTGYKIEITGA
jgi:transcription antitermination factor NusA-like protein